MPKNPYPHSAQITAKVLKDWKKIPYSEIEDDGNFLYTVDEESDCYIGEPFYKLYYNYFYDEDSDTGYYIGNPERLSEFLSPEDSKTIGEKIVKPILDFQEKEFKKKEAARIRQEKRQKLKLLKEFLRE